MDGGQLDGPGDDRALLSAVAAGDAVALRRLYDEHAPWLSIRLARRCNDREVVDDVLQDTFVAVWGGRRRDRRFPVLSGARITVLVLPVHPRPAEESGGLRSGPWRRPRTR